MFLSRKKKGLRISIILFILLNYYFYFLFPMPPIINQLNSYKMKYGLALFSIIVFFCFLLNNLFILQVTEELLLIIGLIIIVFGNILYSVYRYGINSFFMIGRASYPFLICLLFFPMFELLTKKGYEKTAIHDLTILNCIACVLLLLQSILFFYKQLVFMHIPAYEMKGEVSIRDGNIRITYLDTMLLFSFFLSLDKFGNHSENKYDILNIFLSFAAIYSVSQTRSEILICFVGIIICVFKRYGKFSLKNVIIFGSLFLILSFIISYVGSYVIEKFSSVSEISINTRFDELEYYFTLFKKNPFLGYGMIDPQRDENEVYKKIVYGDLLRYSITDIGIVGQMARSGVPILVWYLFFMRYLFSKKHFRIHTCMSVFILLSSINIIVFDACRIIMIPFIFSLYEADNFYWKRKKLIIQEVLYERKIN